MAMAKRIFLFMLVNLGIIITLSVVLQLLGVRPYLTQYGIDYTSLAIFALVWGMGGAFISLGLSRIMAKWMMGVKVIPEDTRDPTQRWLLDTVHHFAQRAGLPGKPQVGIYASPEVNAFATGPTKRRALVAVSAGLLQRMNRDQVEGVLGHEVAHIANGDMVTMTLIQGVINAFVMFIARVIAFAVTSNMRDEGRYMAQFAITIALEIALSILGMIVVAYFSRAREFRADHGGAWLAGREKMIDALQGLRRSVELVEADGHESLATLKIAGKSSGWKVLFSTHPPLEERIRRLQAEG
jgi:heat shock protein HtpX